MDGTTSLQDKTLWRLRSQKKKISVQHRMIGRQLIRIRKGNMDEVMQYRERVVRRLNARADRAEISAEFEHAEALRRQADELEYLYMFEYFLVISSSVVCNQCMRHEMSLSYTTILKSEDVSAGTMVLADVREIW